MGPCLYDYPHQRYGKTTCPVALWWGFLTNRSWFPHSSPVHWAGIPYRHRWETTWRDHLSIFPLVLSFPLPTKKTFIFASYEFFLFWTTLEKLKTHTFHIHDLILDVLDIYMMYTWSHIRCHRCTHDGTWSHIRCHRCILLFWKEYIIYLCEGRMF